MCDWPRVQAVDGAEACLQRLNQYAQCHLATNTEDDAEDSTAAQIRLALIRAGLSDYVNHVFCRESVGMGKTNPRYYQTITDKLNVSPKQITMVGEPLERDVHPALKVGINAVWFNPNNACTESDILTIKKLGMLN
jgi:putative hydrolase of the HAD superfamily